MTRRGVERIMKSGAASYRRLHAANFPSVLASHEHFPTHFSHHPFNDRAVVKKVIKQPFFSRLLATLNHSRVNFFPKLRVCGRRRVTGLRPPRPSIFIRNQLAPSTIRRLISRSDKKINGFGRSAELSSG